MGISVSDYNRTGVFIEEINSSTLDAIVPQEATVHFVPGFSRKGTVFNRPLLLKSKSDRSKYFGDIDRFLEKKGSYFHRTIDVALQTAPVYAMNILKTTSLDTLNYASVSLSAQFDNNAVATRAYGDFFNKSGFWTRDTESFLFFAQNSERMLHLTNVGDKKLTVFMFKSSRTGYDVTAEKWYGGKDKVPTWINSNDLISDYLVRTIVVSGDWSNYVTLAADTNWTKYFDASGLRKTKVNDFIKDSAVTIMADYEGSLIPYFRDAKNNNIFIESLINIDTDVTGLFASYDMENVEADFVNGNVDIIGQSLVDNDKSKINFMSYSDTIEEIDAYENVNLDALGNVIGIGTLSTRTTTKANGTLSGLVTSGANVGSPTTATPTLTVTSTSGKAIISDVEVSVATAALTFTAISTPVSGSTMHRFDAVYIDSTGLVQIAEGTELSIVGATAQTEGDAVIAGLAYPATMANNAIIVGYVFRTRTSASVHTNTLVPVALTTTGFIPLVIGSAGTDITVASTATNILNLTFNGTASATKANYKAYRRLTFFNELVTKHVLTNSILITTAGLKVDLSAATWSDNYTSGSGDKNITITVTSGDINTESYTNGKLVFYYLDNEFKMGTLGLETRLAETGTTNYGIVAKKSEFYQDFYNGMINTGDFFYVNQATTTSMKFVHYTNTLNPSLVGNYIVLSAADSTALGLAVGANNLHILLKDHSTNNGDFVLSTGTAIATVTGIDSDFLSGTESVGDIVFTVNNLVATYLTTATLNVYNYDSKVYLKMYTIGSDLTAAFMNDNTLTSTYNISSGALLADNLNINVYSGESSYEQTLEIEQHSAYTITDNKVLIDSTRYPEVKVGNYVKAYVDGSSLQPGEVGKKFARILKKTPWSENATYGVQYSEITTDVKIDITTFGSDLQTTRYTTIEDYIDTYKAITLGGFAVHSTSIPDGTETRQSEILDVIAKETNLYNAIVNKETFGFRYLIDSFGLGLTEFSKQQLADIAGKRKNCIAFLNMPSVKAFKDSSNPSFINVDGTLNTEYVKLGGNPDQNPAFLYSLAQGDGNDDGRDASGYTFGYVTVNDNGRPMIFPPSSYVANTYMRKNNSSIAGVYNWTIAAGVTDGKILGISGVEMDLTEFDLEQLNDFGVNPIVYSKNDGYYLETEYTASTDLISSLSFLHSREVLIDLENELYSMLKKYRWKFNTAPVRAKIKREADEICQRYVDRSGLYAFNNVIDETNNTSILIDNQFGLLETQVEIIKGLSTIVNQIYIMKTGDLGTSTGFTA